ncbi:hypothetical protein Ga0074812_15722 [Parafrankia irregularis]|uniref:Uncharacterized protein n=1 Tax=Parafrankia irregularis TaxID=795642 RepID=A0A0S4R1P9_9ACTN|nr:MULTISPECIES: hypothetical protein [Parafrankia]MBE3206819.1 hypothetical protein [Parafrankia sp. CH37]CUU61132.1 hypothetical protein Ga0074812_15722 [Parafrankia irregularis]
MSFAEQRRADRAATREQRRADRAATREQDRADLAAAREQDRADLAARDARKREDRADRDAARAIRQAAAEKRKAQRATWRSDHAVELLIYPLAAVSAVMAIPAMAIYGYHLYGNATGAVLPALSELGVWAFAMAITTSRRRYPARPTLMLTAGVVIFGAVAFGLNFAHGAQRSIVTGAVMAVVSISGVVAHQLAVATPPRSRAERAQARIDRAAQRRIDKARRIAASNAVVELAADGTAHLVYTPGLYTPDRSTLHPAEPAPTNTPDQPAESAPPAPADVAPSSTPDQPEQPAAPRSVRTTRTAPKPRADKGTRVPPTARRKAPPKRTDDELLAALDAMGDAVDSQSIRRTAADLGIGETRTKRLLAAHAARRTPGLSVVPDDVAS